MSGPRVASFPVTTEQNPYQRLLLEAVRARGVRTLDGEPALKAAWVRQAAGRVDAVHLHWVEFLYGATGPRPVRAALARKRALSLVRALGALRRSPVRLVWTVHNLRPHETPAPRLADWVIRSALRASDAIVVHSAYAGRRLAQEFATPVTPTVLHLPHYIGVYPPPRAGRAATRRALGIPADAFTHLIFGQLRPYKQVPEALAAFGRLRDPDARLVVAGGVRDPALEAALLARAAADPRVVLRLGEVSEADVSDLHAAADAALINHRDVFSSSALMTALGFGLPVVAPAGTTAQEVAAPPAVESIEGDDLTGALERVATGDPAARRAAARAAAEAHPWSAMADGLVALYQGPPTRERP